MSSDTNPTEKPKENQVPKMPRGTKTTKKKPNPKLRNYLFQMVLASETNQNLAKIIKWTKKSNLEFQFVDPQEVARLWSVHRGKSKNMDYESLSRSLRSYYEANLMRKIPGKNFRYQFVPDAWTMAQMAQANAKKNNFSIASILGTK